jgi:hypothetical protein
VACSSASTDPTPPPAKNTTPPAPTATNDPQKQPDPTPEARKAGDVRLLTYFGGEALVTGSFTSDPKAQPKDCTTTTSGSCALVDCPTQTPPPTTLVSAGQLEIYGGTPEVSIQVDPNGGVYAANKPAPTGKSFVPAARVTVRASGGDVPAFDANVDFPEVVLMSAPALGSGATAQRSQDLPLAWTRGSAGRTVEVVLSGRTADRTQKITCELPAETGKGAIPATLLGKLPAGAAEISAFTYGKAATEAGLFDVTMRAGSEALTSAQDAAWSGRITLK